MDHLVILALPRGVSVSGRNGVENKKATRLSFSQLEEVENLNMLHSELIQSEAHDVVRPCLEDSQSPVHRNITHPLSRGVKH